MKKFAFSAATGLLFALLAGCDGGNGGNNGGGGAGGNGGGGGGKPNVNTAEEVAECKKTAESVRNACGGQADRECLFEQYALLCESERAAVLTAGLKCLLQFSSGSCRTFSDPSGAEECVGAAFAKFDTKDATAAAQALIGVCAEASVDGLLNRAEPPFSMVGSATLDTFNACVQNVTGCEPAIECYKAEFAGIWSCN